MGEKTGREGQPSHVPSAGIELEGQHRHEDADSRPNEHGTCSTAWSGALLAMSTTPCPCKMRERTELQPRAHAQQMCSLEILRSTCIMIA